MKALTNQARTSLATLAVVLAGACTNLGTAPYSFEPRGADAAQGAAHADTPLYARDGTVVNGSPSGSGEIAPRELTPSETGRTYILELYQRAIDERDALRHELDGISAELATAKTKLAQSDGATGALQARVAELEAQSQKRLDENIDLAARLVTAQIRRLQAEKVLLEARLAQDKAVASEGAEQK